MTRIVSPEEFATTFDAVVRSRESRVASLWWDLPRFTRLMLAESRGILREAADNLELQYCQEYRKIDAIMCEKVDTDNFPPKQWPDYFMAEQLTVVIEHEQNVDRSQDEMNKLSTYNSPLKVLITYPDPDEEMTGAYLARYADILRRADVFKDFGGKRKHLVIFGRLPEEGVHWESYVYRRGKFVPVAS